MKHPQKLKWLNALLLPAAISSLSVFSTQAVAINSLHTRAIDARSTSPAELSTTQALAVEAKSPHSHPILIVEGHVADNQDFVDFTSQSLKRIDSALEVELGSSDLLVMSTSKSQSEPEVMVDSDDLVSETAVDTSDESMQSGEFEAADFGSDDAQSGELESDELDSKDQADGDAFNFSDQPEVAERSDPLRFINKPINQFNSALDKAVLKPTAKAYQKVTPAPVRSGVRNFFKNLREPWTAVNLMLQGKPADSAKSLGRFTLNTVTSLGFVDVSAKYHGVTIPKEDLGQTLAVWGVPNGPYMVLPILGPSTLRDTAGLPFDSAAYPPAYLQDDAAMIGVTAADGISLRAELLSIDGLVDPYDYELLKSVYLQNRAYEIGRSGATPNAQQESFSSEGFGD